MLFVVKKQAKRRIDEQRRATLATTFGERIHLDLVGPTQESLHGERYLLVARDEASDYPVVAGLKTKESSEVWQKFDQMFKADEVRGVRTDNGG